MEPTYDHNVGEAFKRVPEIYSIESTNACDLECPMCLRTTNMNRKVQLLDVELLKLMHSRGDFAGTQYIELQMAGEPTLHPKLGEMIKFLQRDVGVLVGLSTHGLSILKKDMQLGGSHDSYAFTDVLLGLDALTISVDSLDEETYHKMRHPAHVIDLTSNMGHLLSRARSNWGLELPIPFIELQLVKVNYIEGSGDVAKLEQWVKDHNFQDVCSVRTISDCFYEMQGKGTLARNAELCVNPWTSVSVRCNGDVVSCCLIFDSAPDSVNVYGNLYQHSLQEIWEGPRVKAMQRMHIADAGGTGKLHGHCAQCHSKSTYFIHQTIVSRLLRQRGR